MANEDSGCAGAFLFATGAVVGAVLGVLFAPRSGNETREHLAQWLKERREKGEDLLHKVKEESSAKRDALVAAAKAAKQTYSETNAKHHDGAHS